MRKILLVLALSLPFAAHAADVFETGADLYKLCQQAADPAKRSEFSFGLCMGYIDGYISGYLFKKEVKDSPPMCDDIEKRSRRQVLNSVVDYLAAHPESQGELKSVAMYRAMLDKMTCPTKDANEKPGK
ncbi:MAG TPA: Rap1a/Tai family immunity protein [Methylophilaceae bacterium]|jgi:hypothetical protein